ncbi:NADH-quinone oxidoreductase subunit C [Streptomyces sp. NEAU-W12]|uniref:NADH-quinone oxidoreductase subunit C n=1 Tax=Streptomyces sp. NEAU-W12 TaxID=2994668 RepID=UPI00224B02E3|nr:NADH-quinone oxidoreductase subunit C [Streptomyces sp. NEAU-W12]MCX2926410.1 NADH-quinone oxidoreductase subunit C [Streptomyces sp. NEAU-W12]
MTAAGWLPTDAEELFGTEAAAEESYDVLTVDVPPASWLPALETARDRLGCTYFDWLSAVDEPGTGFRVAAHVVALSPVRRLLLRTTVPHEAPVLPSAVEVYAGAAWHERETYEMFGVDFTGHPALDHLLLPDTFEGHPLRKDFVLAARVAKAWPGAKEPGESEHGGPKRRQMLPPGVPDPNEWGPLKGRLPQAPSRPARGGGRAATGAGGEAAAGRAPGDRPVRRTRTAAEGSASQAVPAGAESEGRPARPPRRNRTAAEGSASQQTAPATESPTAASPGGSPAADTAAQPGTPPSAAPRTRRARSASEGSASQRGPSTAAASGKATEAAEGAVAPDARPGTDATEAPATEAPAAVRRTRSASEGSASQRPRTATPKPAGTGPADARGPGRSRSAPDGAGTPDITGASEETEEAPDRTAVSGTESSAPPRSPDAPWHHARPAYSEPESESETRVEPASEAQTERESARKADPDPEPDPESEPEPESGPSGPSAPDTPSGGPR